MWGRVWGWVRKRVGRKRTKRDLGWEERKFKRTRECGGGWGGGRKRVGRKRAQRIIGINHKEGTKITIIS